MRTKNLLASFSTIGLFFYGLVGLAYGATSPSLGQAASFGILSGTYTNTVSGTTITGDLGYTTGPAVAPTISGTTYINTGIYSQAGTDQGSALSNLNGQACTFTFTSGAIDLATDTTHGTAGIYSPGVYCTAAASAASIGTAGITLSGSGTYIFKINGALTTVANSVVTLDNGASSCDIFWAPTAATTLGANSTFMGTDIDDSGITIGSTVNWHGRALAFATTVSTTTDTINTTCSVAPTPTPTATPTPTSTPTPTATPTTTPTPTPTVTTTSSNSTASTSTSTASSGESCPALPITIITPQIIEIRRVNDSSIFLSWGPNSGIDNFNIRYGPTNGNWLFNTDVSGFSTTINSLPSNQQIWFQVAARNDCQIGSYGSSRSSGRSPSVGSPGFPNTGNPRFPNTGHGSTFKHILWYLPFGTFLAISTLLICLL